MNVLLNNCKQNITPLSLLVGTTVRLCQLIGIFLGFCRRLYFFKSNFFENAFKNTIGVSNSLDSDQARRFVRPDLSQNCLQRSLADDTSR